ncbi:Tachykinin-like peptides receptor 86C [Blattella germanica]|nr:Tachykinin-like peptides receptor 86C [Blattella germanica]
MTLFGRFPFLKRYNVILLLVTYVVPMCAMVACYTAMGRELWGSRSIGELTQRQIDSIRSKRKVKNMHSTSN